MVKTTGREVARVGVPLLGSPYGATALSSRTIPQAMVHTTDRGGGRGLEAMCSKLGVALAFGLGLALLPWPLAWVLPPWHLPFSLDSCIPQLNPRWSTNL